MGIKSLECNFNLITKTYNSHLHIIVPDEATADILIEDWLQLWTREYAFLKAQDKQKITDMETAFIEVIKYSSKIFTEPDTSKKKRFARNDKDIYIAALDNIYSAMKGRRIFDRFGFNLPKDFSIKKSKTVTLNEYDEWMFDLSQTDWIESETGESLSKYLSTPELMNLLNYRIDNTCE